MLLIVVTSAVDFICVLWLACTLQMASCIFVQAGLLILDCSLILYLSAFEKEQTAASKSMQPLLSGVWPQITRQAFTVIGGSTNRLFILISKKENLTGGFQPCSPSLGMRCLRGLVDVNAAMEGAICPGTAC